MKGVLPGWFIGLFVPIQEIVVLPTGWPPAMLPGPSKGSQPYDPKSRGDIYCPKYKGPGPVLVIF